MEGRINNIETERVVNSELSNKTYNENERSVIKQIEEILFPENIELNKLISIIEAEKFSFQIKDFLELEAVKSLSIDKNVILAEMKYIRFIEFSKDDSKCFFNYDKNTQIFSFSKLPGNLLACKNDEIYEKFNLKTSNQSQNFEILRLKKCKKNNRMILVIASSSALLKNQNFFSNLKFVKENNILIESQDIESVHDKISKADPISAYNQETKNLKAEKNGKTEKITTSRHNSGSENLSWRKVSNENNKEYTLKTSFYNNSGYKKNSFTNGKNNNSNSNYNINNNNGNNNFNNNNHNHHGSFTKYDENKEIKRERFNSETVGNFSQNSNGKFNYNANDNSNNYNNNNYLKNFHKNSFSNFNNIYFSKNLLKNNTSNNTEITIPTLTNNPLSLINKNFSNEIEIDTSKIKYHLQIKFKYTENDIDATYEALKESGILDQIPDFKNHRPELISEKRKDLNKNFFSKNSNNNRDKGNTIQTHFNNAQVKGLSNLKNLEINDLSINNPEKANYANDENSDKKKISLNVNSPKFTRKSIANDIPTFNPLSNIAMPFNKFDKFDPNTN